MEPIKFTQEELNSIAEFQKRYSEITFRFGQLYIEKASLDARMTENAVEFDKLEQELSELRGKEKSLAETFQNKYGAGQLNLETGVFTPNQSRPVTQ